MHGPLPTLTPGHSGCGMPARNKCTGRRKARRALRHDGFKALYRILIGRSANIAGAEIVIIGKDAGDLAVDCSTRGRRVALEIGAVLLTGLPELF